MRLTRNRAAPKVELANDFVESYVCWREACADLHAAYTAWSDGDRDDRGLAFESYRAALDREEQAARVHSTYVRALRA
jgi:hypothetical protein